MMKAMPETLTVDAALQWRAAPLRERMFVSVIKDFDLLKDHIQAWEDLTAEVLEPNPFYEPWMLMPALRSFTTRSDVRVVLVFAADPGESTLCGVFPLEKKPRYKGLPVAAFSLWQHIYCGLCTPLIRAGYGRECLEAFFDWLVCDCGCALMEFNLVSGDWPFHQLLNDCLSRRGSQSLVGESHTRALFRPMESADAYVRAALNREHRKDLRRRARRLSETGQLEYDALEPDGDIDAWVEEYLRLEASGWKGQGGAFACSDADKDYFATIAKAAFEKRKLMMLAIRLDGKPIAMKCSFIGESGSFAFRIAFDENYAVYSPGVLMELENIRRLHAEPRVEWMDSCATPEHPMIDRLWLDRRAIQSVLVPTGKRAGEFVISALPVMKLLNRKVRQTSVCRVLNRWFSRTARQTEVCRTFRAEEQSQ